MVLGVFIPASYRACVRELERRYLERGSNKIRELDAYKDVQDNPIERRISSLERDADAVIDTQLNRPEDVVVRVASHLGLYGREYLRLVDVLIGGQYGSEGKGQISAYLSREYDVLVRVGGPNAGHSVRIGDTKRTFHHLPSGTLSCNATLVLGPGAVINAEKLLKEIGDCDLEPTRISIDPQVMTISPEDIAGEEALRRSIGSTGQGVGFATARRITGRGRPDMKVHLARDNPALRPYLRDTCEILERAYHEGKRVMLEGTQGTGLSLFHGCYPHVTSRDTTVAGCLAEAGISPNRVRKVIMVCRTYPIRVQNPDGKDGTSGFMSQEITWDEIARRAKLDATELKEAEKTSTTKRDRRVSEFDWALVRKSATLNAPTDIALTFADYIAARNERARRFEQLTEETIRFIEEVERVAAAPVSLISTRFHARSIIDRRSWR